MITRSFVKTLTSTEAPAFSLLGGNPHGFCLFLHNIGTGQITYKTQKATQNDDASYQDLVSSSDGFGSLAGTLAPDEVVSMYITTTEPFLRLMSSATVSTDINVGVCQYNKTSSDFLITASI